MLSVAVFEDNFDENKTDDESGQTPPGAMVSSRYDDAKTACPTGWVHQADACPDHTVEAFSDKQTVAGCTCKDFAGCQDNKPHQGHAWCEVPKGKCG